MGWKKSLENIKSPEHHGMCNFHCAWRRTCVALLLLLITQVFPNRVTRHFQLQTWKPGGNGIQSSGCYVPVRPALSCCHCSAGLWTQYQHFQAVKLRAGIVPAQVMDVCEARTKSVQSFTKFSQLLVFFFFPLFFSLCYETACLISIRDVNVESGDH